MIGRMRRVARRRDERGTSLVLALAFMTLFGVSAGLLAQFGAVSFQTVQAVRDQRSAVYSAQGAVDTAIDNVRSNSSWGTNGGTCPTVSFPAVAGHTIDATCVGQAPNGSSGANFPQNAILTMASVASGETGLTTGNIFFPGTVKVGGPVFSNSGITATSLFGSGGASAFSSSSAVTARGACTGTVTGNPAKCNEGSASHPEGNDPNYPSPLSVIPSRRAVPACPATGNKVIAFQPGFYDDAVALSNLTNDCDNAVLWFQPGAYYFDFDWSTATSENTWTIFNSSINIVGGTPKGWSPTSPTRPVIPEPGACKTDTDATPNDGVQWVFGGDSNIMGALGDIELCGSPDANGRELVIYGQKTGALASTSTTLQQAAGTSGYTGVTGWTNPVSPSSALNAIDGTVTSATITGISKQVKVTTKGYSGSSIPTPADFNYAQLRVAHRESLPANVASIVATVTSPTGGTCSNIPITPSSSLVTAVTSTTQLAGCVKSVNDLTNLTVSYTATLKSSGSPTSAMDLDGIELLVTYTPPALRAQSGCVTAVGSGACDLILLSSVFTGSFNINGTIYAPLARIDLELTFATRVRLTRGVILRSLGLYDSPSDSNTTTTVSVPPAVRTVTFIGRIDGARRVRAVVDFDDSPSVGSQAVVNSWSISR
jgi:hypothetical protein